MKRLAYFCLALGAAASTWACQSSSFGNAIPIPHRGQPASKHHGGLIETNSVSHDPSAESAAAQRAQDAARMAMERQGIRAHVAYRSIGSSGRLNRIVQPGARGFSGPGSSALVLYDTSGQWGFLGELYAMATANLAGHFGAVATEPIGNYQSGQVNQYTATIYLGSTYYTADADGIPPVFYQDVMATSRPVIWINDNIWNFADSVGPGAFEARYGWDPTNSFFAPNGSVGAVTQVTYKSEPLTRSVPSVADGGILRPMILGGSFPVVTSLAVAFDTSTVPATKFPWAIRSGNLTYIGEVPFAYVNETDRVIAFDDLLFDALAPNTAPRHRALVRLEDISPIDDPNEVGAVAKYLSDARIPYGFNVIPLYVDPLGVNNHGVPMTLSWTQSPRMLALLKWMLSHGGTIIDEGYTHQYAAVQNPYTGISGDDAEFFRAHVDALNYVIWDGPPAEDSAAWAQARVTNALAAFRAAGLPKPSIWVTPHYYATDTDYRVFDASFPARYERSIYFSGLLSGNTVNHAQYIGQFFPYVVQDVYGSKVLPENLGDYEPISMNNNPIRLPADIIREATLNLAVRDGFASFFYDASNGLNPLFQTVNGIKQAGYTFVSPSSL